jgi:hypothetical protein
MSQNRPFTNIQREVKIDTLLAAGDYVDAGGFFFRAETGGVIKYVPILNEDAEVITKTIPASVIFGDPVLCRKIIASGTTASNIYVGTGL